jgi:CubicO group peptidase (beta-lactamase class C family)
MDGSRQALGRVFARWAARERTPGIAWGVIRDGRLAEHAVGTLRAGDAATPDAATPDAATPDAATPDAATPDAATPDAATPDADSVFRIASMTKSFTGAALMTLVADDEIRLDEPVATYAPELAHWRGPTTDGPPLTVRHLVSMESGLPTDDPWADRHLDLTDEAMDELIAAGAAFAWTPGTHFEYSNLGWGIVGRVIRRVAGIAPQQLVTERLLQPLGMNDTTWTRPRGLNVAEPHHWQDDRWIRGSEPLGDGTIAPMGGLWSTVADLARWIAFFCDADPPRDDPDDAPLPRWARREMQEPRRMDSIDRVRPRPDGVSRYIAFGYGIGLTARLDPRLGTVVAHSGGLPGYGSHMRWLPERNVGIVALSNVTYGDMTAACAEAIDVLADLDALPPARSLQPAPPLREAADRAVELVNRWSEDAARSLFADNVEQDDDLARRRAEAEATVERHGELSEPTLDVDAPLRGDVVAAGGDVRIELELNHEAKVQWWYVKDRTKPSDAPLQTDPRTLAGLDGIAYVVLRPTGALADAYDRWQGDVLDRFGGSVRPAVFESHATCKAWGSPSEPLVPADEDRISDVVRGWATATPPIGLVPASLDVFEGDEHVPIVLLEMSDALRAALRDLWSRSADAALPAGYSDHYGTEGWRAHLSLCYPRERPQDTTWEPLRAWLRAQDVGDARCLAREAELIVFGDGRERRLGRFTFGGQTSSTVTP